MATFERSAITTVRVLSPSATLRRAVADRRWGIARKILDKSSFLDGGYSFIDRESSLPSAECTDRSEHERREKVPHSQCRESRRALRFARGAIVGTLQVGGDWSNYGSGGTDELSDGVVKTVRDPN